MKPSLEGSVIQTVTATERRAVTDAERDFYLMLRQGMLIQLAAIEDYLGIKRSVVPKARRERGAPQRVTDHPVTTEAP